MQSSREGDIRHTCVGVDEAQGPREGLIGFEDWKAFITGSPLPNSQLWSTGWSEQGRIPDESFQLAPSLHRVFQPSKRGTSGFTARWHKPQTCSVWVCLTPSHSPREKCIQHGTARLAPMVIRQLLSNPVQPFTLSISLPFQTGDYRARHCSDSNLFDQSLIRLMCPHRDWPTNFVMQLIAADSWIGTPPQDFRLTSVHRAPDLCAKHETNGWIIWKKTFQKNSKTGFEHTI